MNKLIVIPARGGSKGIYKKNIHPLCGKPLICYTLDLLNEANLDDTDISVSTDDDDIINVVRTYENIYIIKRPIEISGDTASTEDALIHALNYMKTTYSKDYNAVLTLQPTSPLRTVSSISGFIEKFENEYPKYDAMLSLSEDRTDFWIKNDEGEYERLFKNAPRRRQERKPLFAENSAYYITETNALMKYKTVLGSRTGAFVIDAREGVDINENLDLAIAEALLKEKVK